MNHSAQDLLLSLKNGMPGSITELARAIEDQQVPESSRQRLVSWFLEMKARERAIPVHTTFEITPLCNLDCKMCYVHLHNDEFEKRSLLSLDTWKDIASQARLSGTKTVTLTGGECLTYPAFDCMPLKVYLLLQGFRHGYVVQGLRNHQLYKQYHHLLYRQHRLQGRRYRQTM